MNRRLTQPMRQVLRNLIDGQPIDRGVPKLDRTATVAHTVLSALRKRGLVEQRRDCTFEITPQGREALSKHEGATQ
jgi:predicted transcriptional regulator